jgi:hypothetical protein
MRMDSLDHVVLTVSDMEATLAFYCEVLGMEIVSFAGGRKALVYGGKRSICTSRGRSSSRRRIGRRRVRQICASSLRSLWLRCALTLQGVRWLWRRGRSSAQGPEERLNRFIFVIRMGT